jgi:hypothetical protein
MPRVRLSRTSGARHVYLPVYMVWAIKFARGARLQKAIKRAALIEAESGVQRWRPQGSLPTAETPRRPVQSRAAATCDFASCYLQDTQFWIN